MDFHPKILTTLKNYTKEQFFKDVTAGIIVAIIALPLSIALAIASGVSPEKGLFTAIIAGFIISLLGGSRVQIGGPTGAFMVIVLGIINEFGIDGLIISTILAGIIMVIFGLVKLGNVIKFMPYPIITGFTSGIAVIIFTSQVKDFLGLSIKDIPDLFIDKWISYFSNISTVDLNTFAVGMVSIIILLFWSKISKKIPAAFIVLVSMSLIVWLFKIPVETIGTKFGELSSELPVIKIPDFDLKTITLLIGPAFTIALLGSIESLLSAVVADGMIGSKHRSNTELIAQGLANIASGLFGGIPATGAIARTAANIKNGGRTPIAGIVHSLTLLLIVLLFMPLAKMIPIAALSAILIIVAYNMSEWREFLHLTKGPKSDTFVLLVTFLLTIFFDLVIAIQVGVVLASLLFMKRMIDVTTIDQQILDQSEGDILNLPDDFTDDTVQIYKISGPFFFGATERFVDIITNISPDISTLILDMSMVPMIDATAVHALKQTINTAKHHHVQIKIINIANDVWTVLDDMSIIKAIGSENVTLNKK